MATRDPSRESLERTVATGWRFPEFELFRWAWLTCGAHINKASKTVAPGFKTEDETVTIRGDWFIVLVIGGNINE